MKIKNNRNNFVVLQLNDGLRKRIYKIKPSEIIDIPELRNIDQVVNKFLFVNGNLSVITSTRRSRRATEKHVEAFKEDVKL